jgi:hypothetical protein
MSILTLISWNMHQQTSNWNKVLSSGADAALLQEAKPPPPLLAQEMVMDNEDDQPMVKEPWRATAVGLTKRIEFTPIPTQLLGGNNPNALMVSRPGTVAPAIVRILETGETLIIVSLYSFWANPIKLTDSKWIYADASVHRLISDLSALIGHQNNHKIIVAGDFNCLYGYAVDNSQYWQKRYSSIFDRMDALGLRFIGPRYPEGGLQAFPWPKELPMGSRNVPTYRTKKDNPETATRQLDYVFASESIADRITARAANSIEEWGPSDHCQIFINLD